MSMNNNLIAEAEQHREVKSFLRGKSHVLCTDLLPVVAGALSQSLAFNIALSGFTHPDPAAITDSGTSHRYKTMGRAAFQAGDYGDALAHYTDSLRLIDEETISGKLEASVLHANRSLCLMKLNRPQEAAVEARAAIAANPSSYKAEYRLASALVACQQLREAHTHGLAALELLTAAAPASGGGKSSDLADVEALVAGLAAKLARWPGTGGTKQEAKNGQNEPGRPAGQESADEYLGRISSGMVTMTQTPEAGRQLQAACAIKAGTDVLRETPIASVVLASHHIRSCYCCHKFLSEHSAPFPCKGCALVLYCSPACRDADLFHQPGGPECGGQSWATYMAEEGLLALRLARRFVQLNRARQAGAAATSGQQGALPRQLLSGLVTHKDKPRPTDDALRICVSVVVAYDSYTRACKYCPVRNKEAAPDLSLQQVLNALLIVASNAVVLRDVNTKSTDSRRALAVYAGLSCANHSCRPNMTLRFDGNVVVARCHQAVPASEALTISYGPQEGESVAADRQLVLSQHYFFNCTCLACQSPSLQELTWGRYTAAMACLQPGCPGGWAVDPETSFAELFKTERGELPFGVPTSSQLKVHTCDVCGHVVSKAALKQLEDKLMAISSDLYLGLDALADIQQITGDHERGMDPVSIADVSNVTMRYAVAFQEWHKYLHQGNKYPGQIAFHVASMLGKLIPTVKQPGCGARLLEWARLATHLQDISSAVLEHHFPASSIQLAANDVYQVELLDRLCAVMRADGGDGSMEFAGLQARQRFLRARAERILGLHFGPDEAQLILKSGLKPSAQLSHQGVWTHN